MGITSSRENRTLHIFSIMLNEIKTKIKKIKNLHEAQESQPDPPQTGQKRCVLDDSETADIFYDLAATRKIGKYKLAFSKTKNDLVFLLDDGTETRISKMSWATFSNTIVSRFDFYRRTRQPLESSALPKTEDKYKTISIAKAWDAFDHLRSLYQDKRFALEINNMILNRRSKVKWDGQDRFITPWTYKDDQFGYGQQVLRKLVQEMLLYQHFTDIDDEMTVQQTESYALIGPQGVGKSAMCEILGRGLGGHTTLQKRMDYGVDLAARLRSKSLVEIAEGSFLKVTSSGDTKDLLTTRSISARRLKSNFDEVIPRSWVYVSTSNYKDCIPKEAIGRRFLPLEIDGMSEQFSDIIKDGKLIRRGGDIFAEWLRDNLDQIYAQGLHEIKNNDWQPTYPSYGQVSYEYQQAFADDPEAEDVVLFNEKLDRLGFDARRYMIRGLAMHHIIQNKDPRRNVRVFKDAGWENVGNSKGAIWKGPDCTFERSDKDYILSLDHLLGKIEIPSLPEDGDSSDNPEPPSDGPNQPPTPSSDPTGTITIPEPNLSSEAFLATIQDRDDVISGWESRIIGKNKVYITPNYIDRKLFNKYIDSENEVRAKNNKPPKNPNIGAVPDEVIHSASYLFYEVDDQSLEDQWKLMLKVNEKLPVKQVLYTGGKSLHVYIKLSSPTTDLRMWSNFQKGLAGYTKGDPSITNPARLMTSPSSPNTKCWKISDRTVAIEELGFLLDFIPDERKEQRSLVSNSTYNNKTQDQVQAELIEGWASLPASSHSATDYLSYNEYLNLWLSSAMICRENNISEEWLLSLLTSHSPRRADEIKRAIRTANGSVTSATFYRFYHDHKAA